MSFRWALVHCDLCPYKKRSFRHRGMPRKNVKRPGEKTGVRQPRRTVWTSLPYSPQRSQLHRHLGLTCLVSKLCNNKFLLLQLPTFWYAATTGPAKQYPCSHICIPVHRHTCTCITHICTHHTPPSGCKNRVKLGKMLCGKMVQKNGLFSEAEGELKSAS